MLWYPIQGTIMKNYVYTNMKETILDTCVHKNDE